MLFRSVPVTIVAYSIIGVVPLSVKSGFRCHLAAALFFLSGPLCALDPAHSITQYAHNAWSLKDGTLPGSVFAFAQTSGGELWIGTEMGLLRFDGLHFVPWTAPAGQPLAGKYISALAAAPDGSLWIGTREGLSHWKDDKVENYPTSKGPAGPGVATIAIDRNGAVWAGTAGFQSGELCRVVDKTLRCYGRADGLPGNGVLSLHEGRSGELWVGGVDGLYRRGRGAPQVDKVPQPSAMIYSIAEDLNGQIWAAAAGEDRILHLQDGRFVFYPIRHALSPPALPKIRAFTLLRDRDGGLWIGTDGQGLLHLNEGRIDRYSHADGLSSDSVRSLFEDREGNVWAGTSGGLDRFRDFPVTTLSTREGLSHDAVGSLFASKDGDIWAGTTSGLDRIQGTKVSVYGPKDGLPANSIQSVFEDSSGRLWVSSGSALSYFEQRRFHALPDELGLVAAVAEDRNHDVWFSAPARGLVRVRGRNVDKVVPGRELGDRQVRSLESDFESGGLWLGFIQGGIAQYGEGRLTRSYTTSDGLGRGAVGDLLMARDGTLWAATEGGLSRLRDGRIATLTMANNLPCEQIHSIVMDDLGALWLNTACGLIRITAEELAAWSAHPKRKVRNRLYDAGDGMRVRPTPGGYFRRAAKSKDGRLWFAVLDGVAVIDPRRIPENGVPPPVRIDRIIADHVVYAIHSHLALPPLSKDLQIDYTAFSFAAPEKVRFRYRLEGFETEWKDAGARREALYTNLPPKQYRFQVAACNNDGVWNYSGAVLEFSILPAYYQTGWFRLACAAAFAASLWGVYFLRVRTLAAKLRLRFEERMAERTRISRELHDTLLQNITGFGLQLDALSKTVAGPAKAKERLRDLREQAEEWLREARDTVSNLRVPLWGGEDLVTALRNIGSQITSGSGVRFQLTVSGTRQPAAPEVQEQLLRMAQEAIRNAIHRGHANEVLVDVVYTLPDGVRILIRDDGCGFDPQEASEKIGHWGLTTMRERAKEIGAELTISAAPGNGATIEIDARMHLRRNSHQRNSHQYHE